MTITVTQQDIDNGQRRSTCECPVALAASRTTGRKAYVTNTTLSFTISTVALPEMVRAFVHSYDARKHVKPFKFDIQLPKVL